MILQLLAYGEAALIAPQGSHVAYPMLAIDRYAVLHVTDADRLADEPVEVESPLEIEVDEHREVTAGKAVAVPARLEGAAAGADPTDAAATELERVFARSEFAALAEGVIGQFNLGFILAASRPGGAS